MKKLLVLLMTGLIFPIFAKSGIVIDNSWVRAVPSSSKNTALFMSLKNTSDEEDVLLSVKTDISKMVMFHKTVNKNGIIKMVHIDNIKIPPHKEVRLKPGGLHIMLIGLKRSPKVGEKIKFTLTFKKSGKITVYIPVEMK